MRDRTHRLKRRTNHLGVHDAGGRHMHLEAPSDQGLDEVTTKSHDALGETPDQQECRTPRHSDQTSLLPSEKADVLRGVPETNDVAVVEIQSPATTSP